jgi:selenocysteine-specific elongation factor
VKVRGLQVHGRRSRRRGPVSNGGQPKVSHHEIERGDILATPGAFEPTSMFDARLAVIGEAPRALTDLDRVRVHIGMVEIFARVRPLGRTEIPPGEEGYAQLRLERPAVVAPGDRFIIRRYSPASTIGGGRVLDVIPSKHRRSDTGAALALEGLERSDAEGRARWVVSAQGEMGFRPPISRAAWVHHGRRSLVRWSALRERSILALGAGS